MYIIYINMIKYVLKEGYEPTQSDTFGCRPEHEGTPQTNGHQIME